MIRSLFNSILALGLLGGCFSLELRAARDERLNFVFILADDLGWTDLGCYGGTFYETPNVDALAAGGMRFMQAYAACPVCSPTRASIMTGKYPARLGTTDYFGAGNRARLEKGETMHPAPYKGLLPLEELTIAEALRRAGYRTFFAGKWHLGPEGFWPEYQGFDVNKGGWTCGGSFKYFSPYQNPRLEDGPVGEHLPDRLASEAIAFIEANKNQPFFTYLSFYSVHTPIVARDDLIKKYELKRQKLGLNGAWGREGNRKVRLVQEHPVYAGMVEAMDRAVGKVLVALDRLGLTDTTAVFFMSDNGGLATSEGHPTSNLPLRAGKGWLYEGGIREPMVIRWPGVTKPASVCNEPVVSTDFYPTMLAMAGLDTLPDQHVDGISLVPLLQGNPMTRGPIFWHYPHYGNQGGGPGGAIRDGDWKLIEWYEGGGRFELYHVSDDISEKQNVAEHQGDKTRELYEKLQAWRDRMDAEYPIPVER